MPEGLRPGSHSLEETGLDLPANVAMFSGTETVIRIEPLIYIEHPRPSEMPSVSYLPSAAPSTKFYHFFPSWFRMPRHHFNLFLWALVFNLFPNLISDPSSLKWKKKKKGPTRLHNLTFPSGWGIKIIREDSPVLLPHNALGLPWWKKVFSINQRLD